MEKFISGYCRALDKSRMVAVEIEDGEISIDCAYENCPHRPVCQIGKQISELLEETPFRRAGS